MGSYRLWYHNWACYHAWPPKSGVLKHYMYIYKLWEYIIAGDLNPSVELKQLDCLDLSWNNHTSVPYFFGLVRSSRYHILPSSRVAEWILIGLETSQTCLSMNYLCMTDLQRLYSIPWNILIRGQAWWSFPLKVQSLPNSATRATLNFVALYF